MFEKKSSTNLPMIQAYPDSCGYSLKRIKFLQNKTLLILSNGYSNFTIYHVTLDGKVLDSWSIERSGIIADYNLIGGVLYVFFIDSISDYEEMLVIYRSEGSQLRKVSELLRESYQHDMDYFRAFRHNDECRLLIIRHNRIHLYVIGGDTLHEVSVLEGGKWFISGRFVVNSMARDWELYDASLELINMFRFEEDVEWLSIEASVDNQIIAMATDNAANEIGGLYVFDKSVNNYKVHYQRYGFYNISVCHGKVWTSVGSVYSDIGGIVIFDRSAGLKFAHIRDDKEAPSAKTFHPSPVVLQATGIYELLDGSVMLSDNEKLLVVDSFCRPLREIKQPGYDCFIVSADKRSLVVVNLLGRVYGTDSEKLYEASLDLYEWDSGWKKAPVVDISLFRS